MTSIKSREPTELDKATESAVEGEIREFVRRDVATLRRSPEADSEVVANNISTLLQRVAGSSVQEIDRLMGELHTLRELLQAEGARVQRETEIKRTRSSLISMFQTDICLPRYTGRASALIVPFETVRRWLALISTPTGV